MNDFLNKNCCLITGGGSGIGKSLAITLSAMGKKIYICGRNREKLDLTARQSSKITSLQLDVTNKSEWLEVIKTIEANGDTLDMVIFNAGICNYIDLPAFNSDDFKEVFDTNFMGLVYGIEATLPILSKASRSQIVGVTSSVASLPLPRAEAYGASKSAATYLLNSLRLDLADSNINVCTVLPGFVETPLTDRNDFDMPFIITPDKAAQYIVKGLAKNKKQIYFPGRFTWPLRLISHLPLSIRHKIALRFKKP